MDRITKLLLALIALGLWGLLLRPVLTPTPTHAQDVTPFPQYSHPAIATMDRNRGVYAIDNAGYVYLLDPDTLIVKRSVRLRPKP